MKTDIILISGKQGSGKTTLTLALENLLKGPRCAFLEIRASANGVKMMSFDEVEQLYIVELILVCDGNVTAMAQASGMGRATLYRKFKQYGIQPMLVIERSKGSHQP